jgi:hypothetical protein
VHHARIGVIEHERHVPPIEDVAPAWLQPGHPPVILEVRVP